MNTIADEAIDADKIQNIVANRKLNSAANKVIDIDKNKIIWRTKLRVWIEVG